ncbi:hypothetical protein RUND412_000723 [Rhizina undulata]
MLALRSTTTRAIASSPARAVFSAKRVYSDTVKEKPHVHHEEGFGKGFYISIAAAAGCLALYKLEQKISGAEGSPFTRMIEYYADLQKVWEERNDRHTRMAQRAAADRSLFQDSKPSTHINLKFPEVFNSGSPHNRETGWSGGDLTALYKHYEEQRK